MIGTTLSHYRIVGKLGEGGMGEVYLAEDLDLDRRVALKLLPLDLAEDPDRIDRFEREAKALAALNHPNIVTIYSVERNEELRFVTMELVRGKTLESLVGGPGLELDELLRIAIPIVDAVAAAHDGGITHRDLKPANIMVGDDGRVKILDFGLAKLHVQIEADDETQVDPGLTRTGMMLGTASYMAPEQIRGEAVDHRADIFSLGVILYIMASGEKPFKEASTAGLIAAILRDQPRPLDKISPGLPSRLGSIVARCMEKNPGDRYPSAHELSAALQSLEGDHAEPWLLPRPFPARLAWAAAAIVLVALTAVGVANWPFSASNREVPESSVAESRRSIAVVGFQNLGNPGADWVSTALAEFLATELAAGGQLRVIDGESVARMKIELSLPEIGSLGPETLSRIRDNVGTDLVVVGNYMLVEDGNRAGELQLSLNLQDTRSGSTVAGLQRTGTQDALFDLLAAAGSGLRAELGVAALSTAESAEVQAVASESADANRLYAEGLRRLRAYDADGARLLLEEAVQHDPEYALAHAALSQTWSELGYDLNAQEAAATAAEYSAGLPRRESLLIQGRFHETSRRFEEAIEDYRILWGYHSDDVEHGLRLAAAQVQARRLPEALQTIDQLRGLPGPSAQDPRIDLTEATIAREMGDFDRALRAGAAAERRGSAAGTTILVARALSEQGASYNLMGRPDEAVSAIEKARAMFLQVGDQHSLARLLNTEAIWNKFAGRLDEAEQKYREALEINRRTGSAAGTAATLSNLSVLLQERGDFAEADALLEESLELSRRSQDTARQSLALVNIAYGLIRTGDLAGAREASEASMAFDEAAADQRGIGWNLYMLGRISLHEADLPAARAALQRAREICEQYGYEHLRGYVLVALGELSLAAGELDVAAALFDESIGIRETLGENSTLAESRLAKAFLEREEGRAEEAERLARVAVDEFARGQRLPEEVLAWALVATVSAANGDIEEARQVLASAAFVPDDVQDPAVRIAAAFARAALAEALGDAPEALIELEAAVDEARRHGLVRLELESEVRLGAGELGAAVPGSRARLRSARDQALERGLARIVARAEAALDG